MKGDSEYQTLLNSSFRFISFRPRSEKELRDFLNKKLRTKKIFGPGLVDKLVDRMRELGYVDDTKFVTWWVEQRQGRKPKGMQLIIRELMSKGIARDIIEQVLSTDITDQKELAIRAAQKKATLLKKLPIVEQKKKLGDFLMRRGFSTDVVRSVVDDLVGKGYNLGVE